MSKPVKITPELLRKLQLTQLEILVEFDRVCRKNNIKYCLACGTLLGAVRHKGFIPWDDDVDVWMMRDEYDRFCKISDSELGDSFFFQNWDTDPYFNSAYGKIRKIGTRYVRVGQEKMKYKDGIYIDVLPLDNAPNLYWDRWSMLVRAWMFRKLTYAKAGSMCEKSVFKRLIFLLLSLYPQKLAKKQFQHLITKYNDRETLFCKCLGDIGFNAHWKDDFREYIDCEFEGHLFWIPSGYDSVLKKSIGMNYMQLPPADMRKPHANASFIDFGKEE